MQYSNFFCILEKRYNPQNENDAEELLKIFENLSDSDTDLSDDERDIESEYTISRVEVPVGVEKIGPQAREIVESDEEDEIPLSILAGSKKVEVIAKASVKWRKQVFETPEIIWKEKENEDVGNSRHRKVHKYIRSWE